MATEVRKDGGSVEVLPEVGMELAEYPLVRGFRSWAVVSSVVWVGEKGLN